MKLDNDAYIRDLIGVELNEYINTKSQDPQTLLRILKNINESSDDRLKGEILSELEKIFI